MRLLNREEESKKHRFSRGDAESPFHPHQLKASRQMRILPDIRRMGRH